MADIVRGNKGKVYLDSNLSEIFDHQVSIKNYVYNVMIDVSAYMYSVYGVSLSGYDMQPLFTVMKNGVDTDASVKSSKRIAALNAIKMILRFRDMEQVDQSTYPLWRNRYSGLGFKLSSKDHKGYKDRLEGIEVEVIEYPVQSWLDNSLSASIGNTACINVGEAYKKFFSGGGYPKRKKGSDTRSFTIKGVSMNGERGKSVPKDGTNVLTISGITVKVRGLNPKMVGTFNACTFSKVAGKWYVSVITKFEDTPKAPAPDSPIGIDRGVVKSIVTSDGDIANVPDNALRRGKHEKRIVMLQRRAAKQEKGSKRWQKTMTRIAALQSKKANIRRDWQDKITTDLACEHNLVILEDLNTKGMTKSSSGTVDAPGKKVAQKKGLNRSILEQSWYHFETLLSNKLNDRGGKLVMIDPAYTSQQCSACGHISSDNRVSQASFKCVECGHTANADHNAAINILNKGLVTE
jgi:putative transposase